MKHLLALCALLLCLGSAAVARPVAPDPYVPQQNWHAMLSADDQRDFDNYYGKWMEATRKNDRDAMSENTRKMQDIMTRNNIPADVSFDQVASASAYPNPAYSASVPAQRLSADDQKDFDKYYAKEPSRGHFGKCAQDAGHHGAVQHSRQRTLRAGCERRHSSRIPEHRVCAGLQPGTTTFF